MQCNRTKKISDSLPVFLTLLLAIGDGLANKRRNGMSPDSLSILCRRIGTGLGVILAPSVPYLNRS
jgi:hypothetical protein